MSLLEELKGLGVDIDEGMDRLMGNTVLYEKMLGTFAKMMRDASVQPDFDNTDYKEIIEKTHAIKGASGNLSIIPVYESYSEIVRLLREDKPEQAKEELKKVIPVQDEIIRCIEKHTS